MIRLNSASYGMLMPVDLLARRFSGGAFTFTLIASSSQPTTSSRDDPGTTFRRKRRMRSTAPSGEPVLYPHLGQGQLAALRHGGVHSLADGDHEADHVVAQRYRRLRGARMKWDRGSLLGPSEIQPPA